MIDAGHRGTFYNVVNRPPKTVSGNGTPVAVRKGDQAMAPE